MQVKQRGRIRAPITEAKLQAITAPVAPLDPISRLSPENQVNIWLVQHGVRPSGIVSAYEMHHLGDSHIELPIPKATTFLDGERNLLFGSNIRNLTRLFAAYRRRDRFELGLALGYPEYDVRAFMEGIERNVTTLVKASLAQIEAAISGKTIPLWNAYLQHVPADVYYKNGIVPEHTRIMGETYMHFVRRTNPGLASIVEESFIRDNLPTQLEVLTQQGVIGVEEANSLKRELRKFPNPYADEFNTALKSEMRH
ncbi:MAG: hypothetical protein KGH64_01145 [Candidatus Micrarchaeota archaeon]|nr:hypothetical protein [Candidatus Micrarchaeota archaeon]MDE1833923.1 hypothetical protein [Candidatus Micrarchaeota archaeon]MDE1859801.1 hypothetical protein [Candidatus Micrarchaeota archaeon]